MLFSGSITSRLEIKMTTFLTTLSWNDKMIPSIALHEVFSHPKQSSLVLSNLNPWSLGTKSLQLIYYKFGLKMVVFMTKYVKTANVHLLISVTHLIPSDMQGMCYSVSPYLIHQQSRDTEDKISAVNLT